ncbi:MAG: 3-hydroxyacyl-ACP dehydratase FabZ [Clostridia bacterium]
MTADKNVERLLPHRDPFLFVDRILECEKGVLAVCEKRIRGDEFFFKGHFPDRAIMPGVLLLEAMAQCTAIASGLSHEEGDFGVLVQVDKAKFKKIVHPGDLIKIIACIKKIKMSIIRAECSVLLDGEHVASCEITVLYNNERESGKKLL